MGHHKVIEKSTTRLWKEAWQGYGKKGTTRLWEEAWQGYSRKHGQIMERSMTKLWKKKGTTRLWEKAWQGYSRKYGQIMESSMTTSWKRILLIQIRSWRRISKKYIKARTQAEFFGRVGPKFRTCSWLGRTIAKEGLVEISKVLPLLNSRSRWFKRGVRCKTGPIPACNATGQSNWKWV